ncbi:MAG: RHS repeat protein, partial [Akkermansia sp.]|nr:RHS repeat protein [Akkermansia sp.]
MEINNQHDNALPLASYAATSDNHAAPSSESSCWFMTVPECKSATISALLGADDLASLSVGPLSLELGPRGQYGGGTYSELRGSASIAPGTYRVETSYSNISLPEGMPNAAIYKCELTLMVDGTKIIPVPVEITPVDHDDEGDSSTCPLLDCGCNQDENGAGDSGEPHTDSECGGNAGAPGGAAASVSVLAEEESPIALSSSGAGRQTSARGGLLDMLWRMNFATFRGMAGVPDGALEIRAREFTPALCSPAALAFNHPFDTQVLAAGGSVEQPLNGAFQVRSGSARINYFCFGDGLVAPLAGSAKRGGTGQMVSSVNAFTGSASHRLSVQDLRGGVSHYDADECSPLGMISAYTTKSGRTYESADIAASLQVIRDEAGAIAQLWNAWDGLMVVDSVTATGYRMAFYLPHQVGAQDATTKLFAVSGSPWRTIVVAGDMENASLLLTDTVLSREPQVYRFICGADGAWSTEQGSDSAKICRHVARELIEQEDDNAPEQYRLVTTLHRGDIQSPDECVEEIWQKGSTGHLCISRTLGYGAPGALTTLYEYDSEGRCIKETAPSGAVSTFTYDACGREMVRMTPYHGNHTLAVYTYYREPRSADPDISYRRAVLNETATQIWREDYTYEEQDGYRRVTKSTQALGCTEPRVEITETWLDSAEEPLCRGRLRMSQGVDGVQTWYSYEACSDFGAVYKVTAETRADGVAVPAHSRREVTYISAVGNNMRHEVYRLLSNGTWALAESETYEYDCENHWVKRTRGNGRVTTRTMMCCGPLSETDEDGVTTTYGYNAAHQLEEVIREEVQEDGVVITPETITTYTRDAAGRVLSERKDIGAMTTIETAQYDLLGREISRTDILNRTTTTAYSEDGLSTTVTTPAAATLITTRHADASPAAVGGTGQRAQVYEYGVQGNALCTTIKLADEAGTLLAQTLTNGFGQTMQLVQPTTSDALLVSHSEYNAKGQLVKQWQSSDNVAMAPTLYEYDSFGNVLKQTLALAEEPNRSNSPITEFTYALEQMEEGVFTCRTQTRFNAVGGLLGSVQKQLISKLNNTLEKKVIAMNERGLTSVD